MEMKGLRLWGLPRSLGLGEADSCVNRLPRDQRLQLLRRASEQTAGLARPVRRAPPLASLGTPLPAWGPLASLGTMQYPAHRESTRDITGAEGLQGWSRV